MGHLLFDTPRCTSAKRSSWVLLFPASPLGGPVTPPMCATDRAPAGGPAADRRSCPASGALGGSTPASGSLSPRHSPLACLPQHPRQAGSGSPAAKLRLGSVPCSGAGSRCGPGLANRGGVVCAVTSPAAGDGCSTGALCTEP